MDDVTFIGWYYSKEFDSVSAVFMGSNKWWAYTHTSGHGGAVPGPHLGKPVTRRTAIQRDWTTVADVDRLYGDVLPGVRGKGRSPTLPPR